MAIVNYKEPPDGADASAVVLSYGGKAVSGANPLPVTGGGGGGGATLVENLWTDDSLAYYVRVDNGLAITWNTISGAASAAPGTGARPAAGASAILDKTAFQAIAAATGYSIGDLIDHYTVADPATGVVLGNFWINVTTGAKLASAPSSANIVAATGSGGSLSAKATAALQTSTEGATTDPLSMDLSRQLRVSDAPLLAAATDPTPVAVSQDTASIHNGATALTPKFAKIALSASGDLVAIVAGKKIRVLSYNLIVAGATTVKFQSNAATDITGVKTLAANGGLVAGFSPLGHFETAVGEKLNMVLGSAVAVGGELTYIEV